MGATRIKYSKDTKKVIREVWIWNEAHRTQKKWSSDELAIAWAYKVSPEHWMNCLTNLIRHAKFIHTPPRFQIFCKFAWIFKYVGSHSQRNVLLESFACQTTYRWSDFILSINKEARNWWTWIKPAIAGNSLGYRRIFNAANFCPRLLVLSRFTNFELLYL